MRTSNKILIFTLLFIALIGAAVHLTLYGRYKSGHFTSEEQIKKLLFDSHELRDIRYVSLKGLMNVRIITADKPKLELNKKMKGRINFKIKEDSLFVWSDTSVYVLRKKFFGPIVENQETDLYVTNRIPIETSYCILQVQGSGNPTAAPDYLFHISNTRLQLGEFKSLDSTMHYFNEVWVKAGAQSQVTFTNKVDSLHAELINSSLTEDGGSLGYLELKANDSSTVFLSGLDLQLIMAKDK